MTIILFALIFSTTFASGKAEIKISLDCADFDKIKPELTGPEAKTITIYDYADGSLSKEGIIIRKREGETTDCTVKLELLPQELTSIEKHLEGLKCENEINPTGKTSSCSITVKEKELSKAQLDFLKTHRDIIVNPAKLKPFGPVESAEWKFEKFKIERWTGPNGLCILEATDKSNSPDEKMAKILKLLKEKGISPKVKQERKTEILLKNYN